MARVHVNIADLHVLSCVNMADLCSAALRVSRDNRAAVARTAAARTAARTATAFLSLVVSSVSVQAAGTAVC